MFDVICIGNLVADLVGKSIDGLPERGTQALVERMELHTGGCGANVGASLAKLGVKTAVIGKVGQDGLGDFVVQRLQDEGCEVSGVKRDSEAATSATMVLVHSDGERSFLHSFGANATLSLNDIDRDRLSQTKFLMIAGALTLTNLDGEPTAELLKEAKKAGIITVLDLVWDAKGLWMSKLAPCLPYVDYFLPNLTEARKLTPALQEASEVADFLLSKGVGAICIKMGAKGSFTKTRSGETIFTPALKVLAIDGLGAGDAFDAGFLAAMLRGESLERCLKVATAVGACCVTRLGATTGVRTYDETLAFMAEFER